MVSVSHSISSVNSPSRPSRPQPSSKAHQTTMLMFVTLSTLLVAAQAGLLPTAQLLQPAPIAYAAHAIEEHSPAHYDFSYSVNDPHTGDVKEQHESRQGDNVQGEYSLVEPDGQRRTVQYTADAINGFNAVVLRDGHSVHATAPIATAVHAVAAAPALPTVTLAHRSAVLAQPQLAVAHPAATISYAAAAPKYATAIHAAPAPIAYTAAHPQLAAPLAYTQKFATPLTATTTYHAAQPQLAYAQHPAPALAYAQHAAPALAYATTQHHVAAAVPAAVTYTQHAAPVAYAASAAAPLTVATSHATISQNGLSYSY